MLHFERVIGFSCVALLLIVWLYSSSSWTDVRQALIAGVVGFLLYGSYAARRRRQTVGSPTAV